MQQNLLLKESVTEKIMREYRLILGGCVRKVTYVHIHFQQLDVRISFFATCATFARAYKRFAICATFAHIKPFLPFVLLLRVYKPFCYLCYICQVRT